MKIYAVRIGDKYDVKYEKYQEKKLGPINWIREEESGVELWWNRMRVFECDINEPIVIIDIDMLWLHDYMKIIEYPIERGEFLVTQNWWGCDQMTNIPYKISGGFYKFYPQDTKYISELFYSDPQKWQSHYITKGIVRGPVGGEMNFVEDCVRGRISTNKLKMKFIPHSWNCQAPKPDKQHLIEMNSKYTHDWMYLGGEFHPDIKLVHYQGWHKDGDYVIPKDYLESAPAF